MLGDTIHAVASPPGTGARAVLRVSGPDAMAAAAAVFAPALPHRRCQVEGTIEVLDVLLPALALCMPGPRSYTGEDVVELHVPGSPLVCAELQRAMTAAIGARLRPARPGEFTARACTNGRLDAAQAEGVLLLIHGQDRAATAAGAAWLGGGLSAAVAATRSDLQDALALLEVGLDFEPGETGAVDVARWQRPLAAAEERLRALRATLPAAAPGGEVLLLGASNAGKSSLCNALAGREAVIVDAAPGTTRDLVRVVLPSGTALWDAPGDLESPSEVDRAALSLRDRLGAQAGAALLVLDAARPVPPPASTLPWLAAVFTKADLWPSPEAAEAAAARAALQVDLPVQLPRFVVSSTARTGLEALRRCLGDAARSGARDAGGPLRQALDRAAVAVARAQQVPALGPELASTDLQEALAALSAISGQHGPEDLLDRIYSRFCLGK